VIEDSRNPYKKLVNGSPAEPRQYSRVRRKCYNFLADLKQLGYTVMIPEAKAKDLFKSLDYGYDDQTLKAYFGTRKHTSRKSIFRRATYGGTYTVSNKYIELIQDVAECKGYLETLGLVHFEKRGKTWFMVIHRDAVLVPQLYERCHVSMKNFSLSPIIAGKERERTSHEVVSPMEAEESILELENKQQLQDEREKLVYKNVCEPIKCKDSEKAEETEVPKLELTHLERLLLKAAPAKEKDRAKVDWGSSNG
jgi:hypothetical protein